MNPYQRAFEEEIARKKRDHLSQVMTGNAEWRPCMHDQCTECHGTGVKINGHTCIHSISCPCPKCKSSV